MPCVPSLTSSNAAVQVVFYGGDLVRMMDAVLHGEVDVIILQGGWLEENFPQNIPLLQILAPKQLVYYGEPYPFLTSTELVPEVALSAAPHISGQLQQRILLALLALNSSTCPAMRAAGIAAFDFAASYAVARQVGRNPTDSTRPLLPPAESVTLLPPFTPPRSATTRASTESSTGTRSAWTRSSRPPGSSSAPRATSRSRAWRRGASGRGCPARRGLHASAGRASPRRLSTSSRGRCARLGPALEADAPVTAGRDQRH